MLYRFDGKEPWVDKDTMVRLLRFARNDNFFDFLRDH
jgi:hypothetical protein